MDPREIAATILAPLSAQRSTTADYGVFQSRVASASRGLLDRILADLAFQREVASHRRLVVSPFPTWAREVAWILANPDGRVSSARRADVYGICRDLLAEASLADEQRFTTRLLAADQTVPFLSNLARDLMPFPPSGRALEQQSLEEGRCR